MREGIADTIFLAIAIAVVYIVMTIISGCTTPRYWSPESHQETMHACKQACEGNVKSYTPTNGVCECKKSSGMPPFFLAPGGGM